MESLISNKVLLFGFIIILVINTIYKPQLPALVKKALNNAAFKIALITYLTFSSNYTIEFSLIVAVTVLTILEMVREIEHFEVTDGKSDDKNTDDKANKTNSSQPNIPMVTAPAAATPAATPTSPPSNNTMPTVTIKEIDSANTANNAPPKTDSMPKPPSTPTALQSNGMVTSPSQAASSPTGVTSNLGLSNNNNSNQPANKDDSDQTFVNKDKNTNTNTTKSSISSCKPTVPKPVIDVGEETVARFMINTASVDLSGNCEVSNYPKKVSLSIGNYKIYPPEDTEEHLRVPSLLASYNTKEKGVTSEINLLVKKGFKITFISKNGTKSFFGATTNEDGYYLESDVISKALLDFVELDVEPI